MIHLVADKFVLSVMIAPAVRYAGCYIVRNPSNSKHGWGGGGGVRMWNLGFCSFDILHNFLTYCCFPLSGILDTVGYDLC